MEFTAKNNISLESLTAYIGKELGTSDWMVISQDHVNQFAALTGGVSSPHFMYQFDLEFPGLAAAYLGTDVAGYDCIL